MIGSAFPNSASGSSNSLPEELFTKAKLTKGFMPDDEGMALFEVALEAAGETGGPLVEIGAWCGKSTIYIGAAAQRLNTVLFSIDHHHGSEENQKGWEYYDKTLVDPHTNRIDTLLHWRHNIEDAGLENHVIAVVGESSTVSRWWNTLISFLFIDGGHGKIPALADYNNWTPMIKSGGLLAIHDVFTDPLEGGRPPFEIWQAGLKSGNFIQHSSQGSLQILKKL
ncbi:MAG: class I SAM-dependent methyltransferase [Actinobacteria bacterium]|nr:class I SAM-dependent methyltransferase [Actinomycetota bacterium]MCL6104602.1 class I SAM-dependent methyltransferase [Actinomycetota bacterium]